LLFVILSTIMPSLNLYISFILLVSVLLLASAVAMMISHVRAWRNFRQQQLDAEEFNYRRRQFRRRMQTSAMLGVLAVALSAGHFLSFWLHSNWFELGFWGVTMLVAFWLALLALVDLWATKRHFARQQERSLVEQVRLAAEARRLMGGKGDGKDEG
jgi:hypothetical protein